MSMMDHSFFKVEQAILPAVSSMLDALIDSAQGARPGVNGLRYAADIRHLAEQSERAVRELAELIAAGGLAPERSVDGPNAAAKPAFPPAPSFLKRPLGPSSEKGRGK